MKKVKASGKISLSNNTDIHVGPTPPLFPIEGQLWLNTSTTPPTLMKYENGFWVECEISVEKLDPNFIDDLTEKHQNTLDEIAEIKLAAQTLKTTVDAKNIENDAYFSNINNTIINNRKESLGWYEENGGLISGIAQSMEGITTRVSDNETNISTLTQTAKGIQTSVSNLSTSTSTKFTQMDDRINLRVEKGDVISQISVEADQGVYIAGKAIYLDGTVSVANSFVAPRILSANSDNSAYTKIEANTLTTYGYFSTTWRGKKYAGNHSMEGKTGYLKFKQLDGGNTNALYYTAKGIATRVDGDSSGDASGVIEFFADGYSSSANSLALASSGNIILESTYTSGSAIYLNPNGSKVIIGDNLGNRYGLRVADIDCTTVDATSITCGSINSAGGTITTGSSSFYFGNFYANTTNINSKSDAIKIGGSTGNMVISGNMTCAKLVETSVREKKKNIESYGGDATSIITDTPIRTYQYNADVEGVDMPYIGLVLDEAPVEVADTKGEGVLVAQGVWLSWKAIQELNDRVAKLEEV